MTTPYEITRSHHGLDVAWMALGGCKNPDIPQAIWWSDEDRSPAARLDEAVAKSICRLCPVEHDCLEYALDARMDYIWGGTSGKERRVIIRQRRRSATTLR